MDMEAARLPTIVAERSRRGWEDKAHGAIGAMVSTSELLADAELERLVLELDGISLTGRLFDHVPPDLPRIGRLCLQIRDRVFDLRSADR
jgi:hypothetical protein